VIPTGPETDQGLRHAHSLRRHLAGRSPTLDDLCVVSAAAIGGINATVTIADRTTQHVVGAFNLQVDSFPRTHARYDRIGDFFELTNMDLNPVLSDHPLVDGRDAQIRSVLLTGIFHQDILVGGVSVASDQREGAFTTEHRAILFRIARVAEAVIRSEVALSKMATEALSVLTSG
jgi:GAF domain-containing protein